jgi:IS30 family transposase
MNCKLRDIVASKLILDWSPEQISGWLKTHYPNNESMRVSHETIYRSLFIQARGETQGLYRSHRRQGLLLRSAESLAAWHQRKH